MISWNLKDLMQERGVTIPELAESLNVTKQSVYYLLAEKPKTIKIDRLEELCLALDCTTSDLLEVCDD